MRATALRATGLALGLTAACGSPAERRQVSDLVELLPLATVRSETAVLDLGTPAARPHLVSGWSRNERNPSGETFVWGTGDESELMFRVFWPRDLDFEFRCSPFGQGNTQPPSLSFLVNGKEAGQLRLLWGRQSYHLSIPRELLRSGENLLTIRNRFDNGGARVAPVRRGRRLSVAWSHLTIGESNTTTDSAQPMAQGDRALFLPWGTATDFYLRLPAHSELSLDALRARGGGGGRLEVLLETEDRPTAQVAALAPRGMPVVELTADRSEIARLTLRSRPSPVGAVGGGLLLVAPQIRALASDQTAQASAPPARALASDQTGRAAGPTARRRPNIIVYLVDTLRADHLGCYGYSKAVSPNIDRFADEGVLFERAVANSSWTRAAVASIFTGLWPPSHGANRRRDKLAPEATTLAELLRGAGYRTAGIAANPNVSATFGLNQGFEHYQYLSDLSDRVNEAAFRWLSDYRDEAPFFLYLHTQDPHDPYDPPPAFRRRFASAVPADFPDRPGPHDETTPELISGLSALYDAEIASNDFHFGRLVDFLKQRGLYDAALVVFVSDHGEEFHDHGGWTHGKGLHAESINVPLIVKLPGQKAGLRTSHLVQQIDLLPTILDYLGLQPPPFLTGRSLLPVIDAGIDLGQEPERVFSYIHLDGHPGMSVIDGNWKLIQRRIQGRIANFKFFDTRADSGERRNISDEHSVRAGYLATLLEDKLRQESLLSSSEAILSPELKEELRALGYLQ